MAGQTAEKQVVAVIPLLTKGKTPSLLETTFANTLISRVNSLTSMTVSPGAFGKAVIGDNKVVIDLTPLSKLVDSLGMDLNQVRAQTSNASNYQVLAGRINGLIAALNNATVECNDDETVTLVIPDIPDPIK